MCRVSAAPTDRPNNVCVQCVVSLFPQLIEPPIFVSNCAVPTVLTVATVLWQLCCGNCAVPTVLCQLCGVTAAPTNRVSNFYVQCVVSLLSQLIERTMFVSNCATIIIYVVAFNVAFVAVAVVTRRTLLFQCSCVFCSFFST